MTDISIPVHVQCFIVYAVISASFYVVLTRRGLPTLLAICFKVRRGRHHGTSCIYDSIISHHTPQKYNTERLASLWIVPADRNGQSVTNVKAGLKRKEVSGPPCRGTSELARVANNKLWRRVFESQISAHTKFIVHYSNIPGEKTSATSPLQEKSGWQCCATSCM